MIPDLNRNFRLQFVLALFAGALLSIVVVWLLLLVSRPVAAAECLTIAQARAKWPTAHLYWHGRDHCWDNEQGGGRRREARAREEPAAKQQNNTDPPPTSVMYPTLRPAWTLSAEWLTAAAATTWPLIIDIDDDDAPDPDRGKDGCCWPRLEDLLVERWRSKLGTVDANGNLMEATK